MVEFRELSARFNRAAGFSTTEVTVMIAAPLVVTNVVVMESAMLVSVDGVGVGEIVLGKEVIVL